MDFTPPRRIEAEYEELIKKLFTSYFPLGELITPQSVLNAFAGLATNPGVLESLATSIAHRMITQLKASNARSWRAAATEASKGRLIFEALEQEMQTSVGDRVRGLVAENARLISSIPEKVRGEINNEISRLQLQGVRPEVVSEYLKKRIPQITRVKANLIARTGTGKAATALVQARSEDLGIHWYEWATSEDSRVRASHRLMDKVLCRWDNPPSPERLIDERPQGYYAPGGIYNCRCNALPIISLSVVSWPAKVFTGTRIQRMTKGKFIDFAGLRRAA